MRWRLYLFLILSFLGIGVAFLGGYFAHDPKNAMASVVLFFLAVDLIMFANGFAQDDGAQVQKKNNRPTE